MELCRFILSDMEGILQEWEEFAVSLPAARSMDRRQLRDHAEKMLYAIVHEMAGDQSVAQEMSKSKGHRDSEDGGAADSAAQSHGSGRLEDGFSMSQMVAEYRALRASVIRRWRKQSNLPDDALDQVMRFSEGIDQALTESVKRFSDELDRARELFMGALGHDLRGPLHVILAAATYLQKPETPERKHADMVDYVSENAQYMERMINDLLDVARTKLGGCLPMAPALTDASEICNRVLADMRALHSDRQFDVRASGDPLGIWDAGRLQQLFSNLVSNAVQHGDPNGAVTVSMEGDAESLVLSVHNEGEPIPDRMLERIFEPLVRGEQAGPATNGKGNMGLGLYIASAVARAHHGSIEVQSSRHAGTTFKVSLPKNAASTPARYASVEA
jgi:signal transduction histidine kinase